MDTYPTERSGEGEREEGEDGPSGLVELLASVKERRWWRGRRGRCSGDDGLLVAYSPSSRSV
jgi:hypothetical protein